MGYLTVARARTIGLGSSTMPEVRVPDQGLAFLREESHWDRVARFDLGLPRFFQEVIMLVRAVLGSARHVDRFRQDYRPLVRAGIINQRAGFNRDVFEGEPDPAHQMGR